MNGVFGSALLGFLVPLGIHLPTFLVIRKMVGSDPLKMMKTNVVGFLVRILLYGIVIGLVVSFVDLRIVVFILSFSGVFVLLHLGEALYFTRLFLTREN